MRPVRARAKAAYLVVAWRARALRGAETGRPAQHGPGFWTVPTIVGQALPQVRPSAWPVACPASGEQRLDTAPIRAADRLPLSHPRQQRRRGWRARSGRSSAAFAAPTFDGTRLRLDVCRQSDAAPVPRSAGQPHQAARSAMISATRRRRSPDQTDAFQPAGSRAPGRGHARELDACVGPGRSAPEWQRTYVRDSSSPPWDTRESITTRVAVCP
jgi:hypothetical protein